MITRIKTLRTFLNLTQQEISDQIGIKQQTWAHYEKGRRKLPIETMLALSSHFGVNLHWLMTGRGDMLQQSKGDSPPQSYVADQQRSYHTKALDDKRQLNYIGEQIAFLKKQLIEHADGGEASSKMERIMYSRLEELERLNTEVVEGIKLYRRLFEDFKEK